MNPSAAAAVVAFPVLAAVALLSGATALAQEACPWIEGKEPPAFTAEDGRVSFRAKYQPSWFRCAKKAGATLVLRFFTGNDGKHKLLRTKAVRSYSLSESIPQRELCGQEPPETEAKATLVGTGEMERLSFTSEVVRVFCARCQWRGDDNMLAVTLGRRGKARVIGKVDSDWHACAKAGSTLSMAFFTGESRDDVRHATEPTYLLGGFEKSHKWKKSFSRGKLCKEGAAFVGYEFRGTGEMSVMSGRHGRQIQELHCR